MLERFIAWVVALLGTAPKPAPLPVFEIVEPDWFVIECARYAATHAPWFDPWRFHGTEFAYPEPTPDERKRNYDRCEREARERHGDWYVDAMKAWARINLHGEFHPASSVARQADPIEWAMKKYFAADLITTPAP